MGGTFSVADIAVGSILRQFNMAGEAVDSTHWSKLAAYTDMVLSRESFKRSTAEEDEMMKQGPPKG